MSGGDGEVDYSELFGMNERISSLYLFVMRLLHSFLSTSELLLRL